MGMKACAMTDHGNMFGAITFYNTMKANGIKPLIGCEVYITRGARSERSGAARPGEKTNFHLVLLAKNLEGYHNLIRLTSKAYTEGFYYKPRIDRELLSANHEGLIALSGCMSGIPSAMLARDRFDDAAASALEFQEIMGKGNYFLEIQDHGLEAQERIRKSLIELSRKTDIPLVATNDAHYLNPEDARAHDILLCIGSGKTINDPNRLKYGSPYFYVRSPEEMWELFGEMPEVLNRTVEIAEMCDIQLPKGINYLPNFPIPPEFSTLSVDQYFEKIVRDGFEKRRVRVWEPAASRAQLKHSVSDYDDRISREIAMIIQMGFPGYFLIVWDFIRYARDHGIPVGPGRGSAAGSLVAYCLEITDVDPLQYDLLFERFLNPERVSMPDIDIDFCVRGRGEVINHVADLYGRDSVCQIITFGTMASKAAIKDVGRALDLPYAEVDRIAKMIPPPVRGRNVSITQALEQVPELNKEIEEKPHVKELIDLARRLEGCARHSSVHAAGVVISPKPLHELIPIAVSSKEELTTQYAMSDLEKTGMLKMDFLALTALTVISDCLNTIKQSFDVEIEWESISLDDPKTMELFAEGRTDAVFQFESSGMQEICRKLKPKGLEDLAALNALYRPGPLDGGMVEDFIARHHGQKSVRYIVPEMKDILSNTYGILVYQEQIMQLAQKLGGYSLGEADLMRRAMGKKNREEMAKHEVQFIKGAVQRSIKEDKARQIFSLMAQFADYGFNRSHSVAYAYVAFQTAYLKAHFSEHFYAAVLSNESGDTSKIFKYASELRGQQIKLLPPDVNESQAGFTPLKGAIRFGLEALKGIGQQSVAAVIETREATGIFRSIYDFVERVGPGGVNKRVLESLIGAGAFDSLKPEKEVVTSWRARLTTSIETVVSSATKSMKARQLGQNGLFDLSTEPAFETELPFVEPWSHTTMLANEKSAIGFYVSGHPLDNFKEILTELKASRASDLVELASGTTVRVGGILSGVQVRTTKKGLKFGLMRLEDEQSGVKCVAWPEVYAKYAHAIIEEAPVLISGRVELTDDGGVTLIADEAAALGDILQRRAKVVTVKLPFSSENSILEELHKVCDQHRGDCELLIEMFLPGEVLVRIRPHVAMRVKGSVQLETSLKNLGCEVIWSHRNSMNEL
jgi:DNA polymerase-3 subunit alpha